MKSTFFWDMYAFFGGTYCLHPHGRRLGQAKNQHNLSVACITTCSFVCFAYSEDEGEAFVRKISKLLSNYTASHPTT
jgi:hypothetical protein